MQDDWQVGPRNRWAYQHVGELIPTVRVPCASASPLPAGAPIVLPLPPYLDGIAVLRDGALVLERYENGMQPSTRHLSQSVAKSVLGLLVTVLGLELDTPVTELVPEVGESGYRGATLRHLMDMTAATDFVEDYTNFWRYDAASGWHSAAPGVPGSVLEYLATIGPAERAHGAVFHYVSPNTDLLGIATARAAGAPLQELLARELWRPMGAEADAELTVDPAGTPVISGGLCATLRDYVRLGAFVLERPELPGLGERPIADPRAVGYGAQWWRLPGGMLAARGIHGQLVAVDRATATVTVMLSSWPTATDQDAEAAQFALLAR